VTKEPRHRTGRPVGSVTLTAERQDRLVAFIRAGAFDHVAAQAVGISPRTFREWLARGEGRGSRPATPKLRALADQVRAAKAESRLSAEVRVYREQPAYWLSRVARSVEGAEGWTEPVPSPGERPLREKRLQDWTDEELYDSINESAQKMADGGWLVSPPCSRPRCRCEYHIPLEERSS